MKVQALYDDAIQIEVAEKMLPFASVEKRVKVAVGGRGSTKSTGACDLLVDKMADGARVCGGREMMNSIEESVHSSFINSIERLGYEGFSIDKTSITHTSGGHAFYKGLSRNPSSIKSIVGVDFFLGEEAQTLSQASLDMLIPTFRRAAGQVRSPELWFLANRMSSKDPFSKTLLKHCEKEIQRCGYYEDDTQLTLEINWRDNPWWVESGLEAQRLKDKLRMSAAKYEHIWEGAYNDQVENSIISSMWFDACIDAHKKLGFEPQGIEIVAFDPSDSVDAKGLCHRHGSVIKQVMETSQGDVNESCDWALDYAIKRKADLFTWDCDGLGISLKRQVSEALADEKMRTQQFKGSEGVDLPNAIYEPAYDVIEDEKPKTNKDTFANKRAQYYMALRDRIYKTYLAVEKDKYIDPDEMISFSSGIQDLQSLRSEVCRIPTKPNGNGKIQIMSKPEMKKIGIDSPNMADALMMSMKVKTKRTERQPIECADAPASF